MKKIKVVLILTLICAMLFGCGAKEKDPSNGPAVAPEENYPSKSIEVVVPFGAGGAVDSSLRPLLTKAEADLGQSMVVVNKEGSGAMVGLSYAADCAADGYTLTAVTNSLVTNILLKGAPFDMNSFDYVCGYCLEPACIVVSDSSDIQTLDDFFEKAQKEALVNVTSGNGTVYHVSSVILADRMGIQFKYVHTDSGSEQAIQLAGGHAEIALTPYSSCASLVKQGKIRVLAVLAEERSASIPDVPTAKELGYENMNFGAYRGVAVPAGTDPAIIAKLEAAFKAAAEDPEIIETYKSANIPLAYMSAEEFKQKVENDYAGIEAVKDVLTGQ